LLALALLATTAAPLAEAHPAERAAALNAAPLVPPSGTMWGAWVAPVAGQTGAQAVAAFESTIGRRLDVVHQYHAWDDAWPDSTESSWADGGRVIFGDASVRTRSGSVLTWSQIANGSQDSVIDAMAARFKAFGRLLFFSFDEEPENRYHANPGTYTLASFTAAYQRIHSRFASAGVQNVVWVWNVTGDPGDESLYTGGLYPGDGYVDWIGWDPYNWNTCVHNYGWRTFDQIVAPFYDWLAGGHLSAASADKPYMLAEYGTVEGGSGAKGQWFLDEASTLPSRSRIKAVVYFNENRDCNWSITTSSSSVSGFSSAGLTLMNRCISVTACWAVAPPRCRPAQAGRICLAVW
jgi:hypothetical protein